ncbi:MAG: PadR family transcriptional regulator [Candidatus Korarchaeota archaeon]|nr:PadR family transcriptional regulator [Candidatus Korarchaeota archaeon]
MRKRWRRGLGAGGPSLGISGLYPLLVLLMIRRGYHHGYEMKRKIEEIIGIPMPPGFIYVTLGRLEASGLVISTSMPSDPRGKKIYRLTPAGEQFLAAGMAELRGLKVLIDRIVGFYEGKEF